MQAPVAAADRRDDRRIVASYPLAAPNKKNGTPKGADRRGSGRSANR